MKQVRVLLVGMSVLALRMGYGQTLEWANQLEASGTFEINTVTVRENGNILVMARLFNNSVDLDPSAGVALATSVGNNDIIMAEYTGDGEYFEHWQWGSVGSDIAKLNVAPNGDLLVFGFRSDAIDFDPGPGVVQSQSPYYSGFVVRLDSDGDYVSHFTTPLGVDHIGVTSDGGTIVIGSFGSTTDFDPGVGLVSVASQGGLDVYISKFDAADVFSWVRTIGGPNLDNVFDGGVDEQDQIYLYGIFEFVADMDPGSGTHYLTSVGNTDIYLLKLDANGEFLWVNQYGGEESDYPNQLLFGMDGYLYHTGRFLDVVDFDPGAGSTILDAAGGTDLFLAKTDLNGELIWVRQFAATLAASSSALCQRGNDEVLVTGNYQGVFDADPGTGSLSMQSLGINDMFALALDTSGQLLELGVWATSLNEYPQAAATDTAGNLVMSGALNDLLDLDAGSGEWVFTGAETSDRFLLKTGLPLTTGIEGFGRQGQILLYPNPASEKVQIAVGSGAGAVIISVVDAMGRCVLNERRPNSTTAILDLTGQPTGVYTVVVKRGDVRTTGRLVIGAN
ncbi:MAG: T9SS type A sorting domain-containing protein [Flavobacteriales bacterium]|nr:T9SS type A sorting domain-containing protein [Flavobacteriales bacterium]